MQVLVHLGLNKCASTFIQTTLAHNRDRLAAHGVCYPGEPGRPAHYGLSRTYGFGPDAPTVQPVLLSRLVRDARAAGQDKLILSSEYLSLYNPEGARRLTEDLERLDCDARFVLFSRAMPGWIRSLFNQYIKTVETGRYLASIDDFVDQVLANRSIDVARRLGQWRAAAEAPGFALSHHRDAALGGRDAVLAPFVCFAGITLERPTRAEANPSLGADALYRIGQLRRNAPGRARDRELAALLAGGRPDGMAPAGYLTISPDREARLAREIVEPYLRLPGDTLPSPQELQEARLRSGDGARAAARVSAAQSAAG